jgi:hypothetical protein
VYRDFPHREVEMALKQASGKMTLLRVHEVGSGFGPPTDQIDVEVVFRLAQTGTQSYGFQLRDDSRRFARQGMLDLLRDAFNYQWTVTTDYEIAEGKQNGVSIRVWLTR